MTHFYGLTPADIDEMTLREVNEYIEQLAEHDRAEREAARGHR